jgi:hypothetical protein
MNLFLKQVKIVFVKKSDFPFVMNLFQEFFLLTDDFVFFIEDFLYFLRLFFNSFLVVFGSD